MLRDKKVARMPEFRARRHKKRLRCDLARLLLLPNVVQGREETRHGLRKNKITTKGLRICGGGSCSTTVHPRCSAATCTFPSGGRDALHRDSKNTFRTPFFSYLWRFGKQPSSGLEGAIPFRSQRGRRRRRDVSPRRTRRGGPRLDSFSPFPQAPAQGVAGTETLPGKKLSHQGPIRQGPKRAIG